MKAQFTIQKQTEINNAHRDDLQLIQIQQVDIVFHNSLKITKYTDSLTCGHVNYKGNMYLYNGSGQSCMVSYEKSKLICLKIDRQDAASTLSDYNLHLSTLVNNHLYLIATHHHASDKTVLIKYDLLTQLVHPLMQTSPSPQLKNIKLMKTLHNMYIVVVAWQDEFMMTDAWVLMFGVWTKLKVNGDIQVRHGFASTVCASKIYVHGGQALKDGHNVLLEDLYSLVLASADFQLTCESILITKGLKPEPRSGHKMTSLRQRYLLIHGGHKTIISAQNNVTTINLQDFWIFDLECHEWHQVVISSGQLGQLEFDQLYGLSCSQNQVHVFGGFEDNRKSIIQLQFLQQDTPHMNNSSSPIDTSITISSTSQNIDLSTSMLHSISYSIKFPFHAIQKIIQFLQQSLKSSFVKIYSEKTTNTIDKYLYVTVEFDLGKEEEGKIWMKQLDKYERLFCCGLRLGKTVLLVENSHQTNQRRVTLVSADGRYSPMLQRMSIFYTYTESITSFSFTSPQIVRQKTLILEILSSLIPSPQSLLATHANSRLFIFSLNIIPTSKNYYYELVFDSIEDVGVFRNNKKVQLLEKIGYDMSRTMEFSLGMFLKYRGSKSQMATVSLANAGDNVLTGVKYGAYLEQFVKINKVTKIQTPPILYTSSIQLYVCHDDFKIPQNNGILMYHSGKLVNRYECQFGRLLTEKFYGREFSKNSNKNVYLIVGEIHVTNDIRLVCFETEFTKDRKYARMISEIQKTIVKEVTKYRMANSFKISKSNTSNVNTTQLRQFQSQNRTKQISIQNINEDLLSKQNNVQNQGIGIEKILDKKVKRDNNITTV